MRRGQAGGVKGMLAMLAVALVAAAAVAPLVGAQSGGGGGQRDDKLLFFAADGLRQDAVEQYADAGRRARLPRAAAQRRAGLRDGLLTQAPPNTGAGWFTLATGAWPGVPARRTTPSTSTASRSATARRRSTPASCRPRRSPRRPSAAARRSPRSSGPAARSGAIDGPTLDFRNFLSGRGVATNYIAPTDIAAFTASFGLQFDHPAGFAGQRAVPRRPRRRRRPAGPTCPQSYSPAQEMRLRVLDCGVDKYGLNAYIYDSTQRRPHALRPRPVLADEGRRRRRRRPRRGRVGRRQGHDRAAATLDGKTGAFLVKVERLDRPTCRRCGCSTPRSRARSRRGRRWPGEPGFTGDFEDFVAERFPSSQAGDFAVLEAGIVSEETYIEQGAVLGDRLPAADPVRRSTRTSRTSRWSAIR